MEEVTKKPWHKSKIILFSLGSILVFGSNLLSGWLTNQGVTPEQLAALQQAEGPVREAYESVQTGGNVISAIGSLFGIAIIVFRAWFTNTIIG